MKELRLNQKELKTLLSNTRMRILRSLKERRKTVTELGRELELSKSTVYEHLTKLLEIGFVRKVDNQNRKWVYYELTEKGQTFLRSDVRKLILIVIAGLGIGVWGIANLVLTPRPLRTAEKGVPMGQDYTSFVFGLVFVACIFLVLYFFKRRMHDVR